MEERMAKRLKTEEEETVLQALATMTVAGYITWVWKNPKRSLSQIGGPSRKTVELELTLSRTDGKQGNEERLTIRSGGRSARVSLRAGRLWDAINVATWARYKAGMRRRPSSG